ncbi:unnamed protein product, partial [Effrenium voratum]
ADQDLGKEDLAVQELQARLAGLAAEDGEAAQGIEKLGGYPTCYWRFLRSVKDVKAAERKLLATLEFRKSAGVNSILQNEKACQVVDRLKDNWPEVVVGVTSDGSPVSFFDIGKAVRFLQLGVSEEDLRLFWLSWMERSNEQQRQHRHLASGGIDLHDMPGTVVVYELKELYLSQLTSCLGGLHTLVKVFGLAEKHYPMNLRKAVVLNAPSAFRSMVWPVVQKALDEQTKRNVLVVDPSEGLGGLSEELLGFSPCELTKLLGDRV